MRILLQPEERWKSIIFTRTDPHRTPGNYNTWRRTDPAWCNPYNSVLSTCSVFVYYIQLQENGNYRAIDVNPTAGKTILALGRLLLGIQVSIYHFAGKTMCNCHTYTAELPLAVEPKYTVYVECFPCVIMPTVANEAKRYIQFKTFINCLWGYLAVHNLLWSLTHQQIIYRI